MFLFSFRSVFYVSILTGTLSLLTCIEQDNPWDPINGCHPDDIQFFSNEYNSQLQKVIDRLDTINATFASDTAAFNSLQDSNDSIRSNNMAVTANIQEKLSESRENHLRNIAAGDCETATLRDSIRLHLQRLNPNVSTDNITQAITKRSADSSRIATIFRETEGLCGDLQIFPTTYRQSILKNYTTPVDWIAKKETITRYSAAILDSNRVIDSLNDVVRVYNSRVVPYNDSLNNCKIGRITDPDSIHVRLDSIQPGDTLAIGEGTFSTEIFLSSIGSEGNYITITGMPDGTTIFNSSARIEVEGSNSIRFENIIFDRTSGSSIGVRVRQNSNHIQFWNCTFRNNDKYGFEINASSNVIIENCRFINNGTTVLDSISSQAGILIGDAEQISFSNVLIANSNGYGIDINNSQVIFNATTITNNILDGILYKNFDAKVECIISNSLFSYNGKYGIFCQNENSALFVYAANNNRFFQNALGPMGGNEGAITKNSPFTTNLGPMFTDTIDYQISPASQLYNTGIGYNKTP